MILIILGILLILFSHPRVMRPIMARLFNEGIVPPQRLKPEKVELIKYSGPNLSLFFVGVILIIIGITIK